MEQPELDGLEWYHGYNYQCNNCRYLVAAIQLEYIKIPYEELECPRCRRLQTFILKKILN